MTVSESLGWLDEMVSMETGELHRRMFSDPDIFDLEMERIFARAWLFLCHETQIPKKGDFFEAPMGRDNVLVVRQPDGGIKALLNTCTHRGNAVCRAEEGNVKNFMCTYHGWTFGLDGELIGVPGLETFYKNELDMKSHPLRQVAQLDSYKGFVFATFDKEAPPLEEYLGRTGRLGLDLIAEQGDMEAVPGVQKFLIKTNWKFTVDNLFDWYHPQITHMSAQASGIMGQAEDLAEDTGGAMKEDGDSLGLKWRQGDLDQMVVLGEFGHAISGPTSEAQKQNPVMALAQKWRSLPGKTDILGEVGIKVAGFPNIFPTAWVTTGAQLSLRIPRSPGVTEIWWYSFRNRSETDEQAKKMLLMRQNHTFGPAGILEQEDGENWAQSTMQTRGTVSKHIPQLLKMGLGRGKIIKEDGLARIEGTTNEHAQLWTYQAWKAWLGNPSWDELREQTTPGDYL